ncbi:hypothetical protein C8N43_1820 [Litoreibacter ponti]|uniref:Lipoprotein n=1 Tax=Litoreibacter ponti TaxID=1510457 RepID=A0A2T6BM50_9RHOB|nr:hypothetical protein [Litoreibacter ponti]PTX57154.1 hypothetical protein C8N43_1820 [Litoreibacter ponti]
MKKTILLPLLLLAACAERGPAVPSQPGMNLADARQAFYSCLPEAPRSGQNAVVGSYVSSVLFGGIIIGPIGVALNEDQIRYNGEAGGVDRCLRKRGYQRRVLTDAEIAAVNSSTPATRGRLLNHLVGGGALDTFASS